MRACQGWVGAADLAWTVSLAQLVRCPMIVGKLPFRLRRAFRAGCRRPVHKAAVSLSMPYSTAREALATTKHT